VGTIGDVERSLQTAQGDPQLRDRLVEVREATAAAAVLGAAAPGQDSIVAGLRECYPPEVLNECAYLVADVSHELAQLLVRAARPTP